MAKLSKIGKSKVYDSIINGFKHPITIKEEIIDDVLEFDDYQRKKILTDKKAQESFSKDDLKKLEKGEPLIRRRKSFKEVQETYKVEDMLKVIIDKLNEVVDKVNG
jgi:hypothetical protein